MGHLTTKDAYKSLEERINWFTQGAPASETLYKILQVLYTEKEAKWVALLPVRPFTLKKAAKIWGTTEAKAEKLWITFARRHYWWILITTVSASLSCRLQWPALLSLP